MGQGTMLEFTITALGKSGFITFRCTELSPRI